MHRLGISGRDCRLRLHDLEDKQAIGFDHPGLSQLTFKIGVAFLNQRGFDLFAFERRQPEFLELVDLGARAIANPDDFIHQVGGRNVKNTFAAFAYQIETVVGRRDKTPDQRGRKLHHHMPAHRHDVALTFPLRADKDNRARLKKAPDFMNW